ncbi:MAG TPA: energy transducer TonB [Bacteroidia bacterium]|nr:energy transducer TonB [Bacteroidia bacterium]
MKKIILCFFLSALVFSSVFSQTGLNVEVLPTNIGGKSEYKRVFDQEIIYPEAALKNNISGKVVINFDIKKDSSISNVKVITCGNKELDAEGLRLFNLFLWVPALKEGQSVGTSWSVAFDFNSEKYAKICKKRGYTKFKYIPDTKIDSTGKIYTSGVQLPMYEKGNFALQDYIKENLEYPRQAQLSNIQGTVVLGFVVEPSGLMTNIGIEKSVGGGCDQEAIRVLEQIKWYPGKYDGKLARVRMTFPVYFILNDEFKNNASGEQK